jgi:hypothetical protein
VPFSAVCFIIRERPGRITRHACAALLFLLAIHTQSSAGSLYPSDHESLLSETTRDSIAVIDDNCADGVKAKVFLVRNTALTSATLSQSGPNTALSLSAAVAAGESSSQTTVAEVRVPDWSGIWRDTGTFFGTQLVAAGIIYTMPQSVSGWSSEEKKNSFKKYFENLGDPVIDKDTFYINYVLHPYWGATYYIRGRERGLNKLSALAYSALISAMYEFGIECFFERPSIQDLIVTPVAGSLLGAFVFEPWRDSIKRKQEWLWYDHAAMVITDPLGVLSMGIEKILGIKSTVMVNYSIPQMQSRSTGFAVASKGRHIGAVVQFPLD